MKRVAWFLETIGVMAIVYGLFAFGHWDLNASHWPSNFRALCTFFMAAIFMMSLIGAAA